MKVTLPKTHQSQGEVPILPLIPEDRKHTDAWLKENTITFNVLSNPADDTSQRYKYAITCVNGTESVREVLKWQRDLTNIWLGLGTNDGPTRHPIAERTLRGTALSKYTTKLRELITAEHRTQQLDAVATLLTGTPGATLAQRQAARDAVPEPPVTNDWVAQSCEAVIEYITPANALPRVKRYLRRNCRKPADMTIREFYTHFCRINIEELPMLPPFAGQTQCLSTDEEIDILVYACPKSWSAEMQRQGFDPFSKTPTQVVEFMERVEVAESINGTKPQGTSGGNSKKTKTPTKTQRNSDDGGEVKYCELHGEGNHTTKKCRTIQRMKSEGTYNKSKNKTWTRKADEAKKESSKELQALIKKAIRKEVHSLVAKKRSRKEEAHAAEQDDSASDEGSVQSFNLADFNFKDGCRIGDDDSVEDEMSV